MTLNAWGGKIFEPLMDFVESHAKDTDIFCMQEMLFGPRAEFAPTSKGRMNLCSEIERRLPDFDTLAYPAPKEARYFEAELLPEDTYPGLVMFIRKGIDVIEQGGFRCYQRDIPAGADFGGKMTASCQWARIRQNDASDVIVMNLHGLWQTKTEKIDTPERITQSRLLQDFLNARDGKKILCGDFNLRIDGESLSILEQNMANLIKKFGVTSTRSSLYTKPDRFADYVLVSPEIQVDQFAVLQNEVSDHLPLRLECE